MISKLQRPRTVASSDPAPPAPARTFGLGALLGLLLAGCLTEYAVGVAGSEDCPGIDLVTDPDNCGACGAPCPAEQACVQGVCSDTCDVGLRCERSCIDPQLDPRHCGDCDVSCAPGEDCVAGECADVCDGMCDPTLKVCDNGVCVCRAGLSFCNGLCVDLDTNAGDCGECQVRCQGNFCSRGECVPLCPADLTSCPDGACADLSQDDLHCGDCDTTCAADEVCVGGACQGYHLAPCEECPCEACGADACCPHPSGPRCIVGEACPS